MPVVFSPKNNGTLQFFFDYRKRSAVVLHDLYPIPCVDSCIYSLGEATIFSTLEVNSSHVQVHMAKVIEIKLPLRHFMKYLSSFVCHLD